MIFDQYSTLSKNLTFTIANYRSKIRNSIFHRGFRVDNAEKLLLGHTYLFMIPEGAGVSPCATARRECTKVIGVCKAPTTLSGIDMGRLTLPPKL